MNTDPLKPARMEMTAATKAIVAMKAAKSMDEFESEWRQYLNAIEKLWQKVERCCQHERAAFQPWQGSYQRLRKNDMLLRYLKQARDADNHSIQDVAEIQPRRRAYRFVSPQGGFIKRLEFRNGEVAHYEGDPMTVEETLPHPVAVKVKNNGVWFNPPTSHLDQPVPNHHPVLLAELGIKFYGDYLREVERKFFSDQSLDRSS
jgi:hypothetical protein